jgi:Tfp pilus assembly protein PilX
MTPAGQPLDLRRDERGIALVVTLMTLMLLTALGMGLMVTTMSETSISANNKDSAEAFYAADAGIERVMQDLLLATDWNRILQGTVQSPFIDGAPAGTRTLPHNGGTVDLTVATNMLNCGKTTQCSVGDMNAETPERPWGPNNPRWALYAYGPAQDFIETGTVSSPMYVIIWVGDDPTDSDDNPLLDGGPNVNPLAPENKNAGAGMISIRAEAFGPNGARRVIETTVARTDTTEIERGYTAQRGQDEQNRRARKAAVQTPGQALTRSSMSLSSGGLAVQ